jgi:GTPase
MSTLDPTGDPASAPSNPDASELSAMLDDLERQSIDSPEVDTGPDIVAQARESLEETIRGLKLTPEEEKAVAEELRQLRDLTRKLDETTVEIAAFGMVSRGKSSVLNALLGQDVFRTGTTHGTTVVKAEQKWDQVTAERPGLGGARLILVDTPGIDEVGGEAREAMAREVARHADLLLFVVSSDLQRVELEALSLLRNCQKPIIVVFNQVDRYPDADRDQVYAKIKDERVRDLVRPDDVVMTAARPDPYRVKIQLPDGTTSLQWERPAPLIEPLKARILDVLEREGKALVALNTLLTAGDLHEEIVAHKLRIRESAANRLIWNFCLAKGVAVGLNPIPVADMAGGLAVDVGMIVALSRVYGISLNRRTATGLVREMMVALGAMGMVELATRLLASGVKSSLAGLSVLSGGLALPLTALGYGAVGLALGGSAATTTYVLGQGAKVYLKHGCQWGPRGIKTVIHQIVAQAKTDSVIERLRDDLKKRITR